MQTLVTSLDNNRNICTSPKPGGGSKKEFTNQQKVEAAKKFSAKLSWKRKQAIELAKQVCEYLDGEAKVFGFVNDKEFQYLLGKTVVGYCDIRLTDEAIKNYETNQELRIMANRLWNSGVTIGALFEKKDDQGVLNRNVQALAVQYSRHRFDPVWNYRKSQLIRKLYRKYLSDNKIQENFQLCHLVLTVPHKGGKYKGEKFYGDKLIRAFWDLRRLSFWKQSIEGGEYGVENTNGDNGLHIHLHCLLFVDKQANIEALQKEIHDNWLRITQDDSVNNKDSNTERQVSLELLYRYKKLENGQYEKKVTRKEIKTYEMQSFDYEIIKANNWKVEKLEKIETYMFKGKMVTVPYSEICSDYYDYEHIIIDEKVTGESKIKEYITPEMGEEALLDGVLECIKYHFKGDVGGTKNSLGEVIYDIELIKDILNHTKGMRLYSRFGLLYKVKELNFNRLEEPEKQNNSIVEYIDPDTGEKNIIDKDTGEIIEQIVQNESDEDKNSESDLKGNIQNIKKNLVNPFTFEDAKESDYQLVLFKPEMIVFYAKQHKKRQYDPHLDTKETVFFKLENKTVEDIGEILRAIAIGLYYNDVKQLCA